MTIKIQGGFVNVILVSIDKIMFAHCVHFIIQSWFDILFFYFYFLSLQWIFDQISDYSDDIFH